MKYKNIKIIIAFDIGLKNIGIAIGNTLIKKSRPLLTIKNCNIKKTFKKIKLIIKTWKPNYFIIGIPYIKSNIYKYCINFSKKLFLHFKLKIKKINENYSSIIIKKKKKKDSKSASLILQQYFYNI
ncbi:Holliday junction resolvase RuvX [Candidatus Zinderia endosymbiont of Aphrophora alni]|uniref:Holliday junction resolvase RuvX n=1 Tax=Candidatus Zinderia endosymbiont of Aphrophora alni TaxID=3077951 RepID=UPI0030D15F14